MFVNKLFTYLTCAYLKKYSYEDDDIDRFSNLHYCTFQIFRSIKIYKATQVVPSAFK